MFRPSFGPVDGTVEFGLPVPPPRAARKLPIAAALSVKGGTGRTTTAVALALRWAAMSRKPVLLVDETSRPRGSAICFGSRSPKRKFAGGRNHAGPRGGGRGRNGHRGVRRIETARHLIPGNLFVLPLRRDVDELVGSAVRPEHLSTPGNPFAFATYWRALPRSVAAPASWSTYVLGSSLWRLILQWTRRSRHSLSPHWRTSP